MSGEEYRDKDVGQRVLGPGYTDQEKEHEKKKDIRTRMKRWGIIWMHGLQGQMGRSIQVDHN